MPRFYLTTAIDYVNSPPHLGAAYGKITADVIARFRRSAGCDTHFLMGADERSLNVRRRAAEQGLDPLDYCAKMEDAFRADPSDNRPRARPPVGRLPGGKTGLPKPRAPPAGKAPPSPRKDGRRTAGMFVSPCPRICPTRARRSTAHRLRPSPRKSGRRHPYPSFFTVQPALPPSLRRIRIPLNEEGTRRSSIPDS